MSKYHNDFYAGPQEHAFALAANHGGQWDMADLDVCPKHLCAGSIT